MKKNFVVMTLAAVLGVAGLTNEALAQSTAWPVKGATLLTQRTTTSPTSAQQAWLKATPDERIKIAEQIGEKGARNLSRSKGWIPLLEEGQKIVPQGPDQIYRGKNGIIHVVEAKGGSGQLGYAYGYSQGTPEWAVKSAERIVNSKTATTLEKQAANEVIKAASEGKLEVHVIRTSHNLGEPTKVAFEQSLKCNEAASSLARSSLEASTQAEATVLRSAAKVAGKAAKVAGPVGLAVDMGLRTYDVVETENKFRTGQISAEERGERHAENIGGCVGGVGGCTAGAAAGAAIGAPFAGVGAIPGAAIGGFIGAVGGGFLGDWLGSNAGREIYQHVEK